MEQKILVAFDDSENAMRAVKFVAKSFTTGHKITLFSVLPDTAAICDMNSPELTPYFISQQVAFCSMEDKKKELVTQALQQAKKTLQTAGFADENIEIKAVKTKEGIARDIIEEAGSGYDTIVLGRKGLSGITEFILGSVPQKVLHTLKDVSVVLVT